MDYLNANKKVWDRRVSAHVKSEFYDHQSFLQGRNTLNSIELNLLGDVSEKKVIHLQCHFGQDTLSLARMGASVTGVDLSSAALEQARQDAEQLNVEAKFIESDILALPDIHFEKYDIVFASYGVIGWHPSIEKFAQVIAHLLKPGGRFVFVEFHPVVWMFDEKFKQIQYSYFNRETIVEENSDSYTDGSHLGSSLEEYSWNHSLGELYNALQAAGLTIEHFNEYDYSPYACFDNCVQSEYGFQIEGLQGKLPLVYSLAAINKSSVL